MYVISSSSKISEEHLELIQSLRPHLLFFQDVYTSEDFERVRGSFPDYYPLYRRRWELYLLWTLSLLLLCPTPLPLLPLSLFFLWVLFRRTRTFHIIFGQYDGRLILSKKMYLRKGWKCNGGPRASLWAEIIRGGHPISLLFLWKGQRPEHKASKCIMVGSSENSFLSVPEEGGLAVLNMQGLGRFLHPGILLAKITP